MLNKCCAGYMILTALLLVGVADVRAEEVVQPAKVVTRKAELLPDPVAKVNGVALSAAEFQKALKGYKAHPGQEKAVQAYVLNQMLGDMLMFQIAQKTEVKDLDKQVEATIGKIKSRFKSEDEFSRELQKQGIVENDLRTLFRRNLIINAYIEKEIVPHQQVSEAEVKEFFEKNPDEFSKPERVRASHILISVDERADSAERKKARDKAEVVLQKVKAGEDFAALAKQYSGCPTKNQGGDLGEFGKGAMVAPFETAAWALKPGEVSAVVETKFGYHIIKLIDRLPAIKQSFDEAKGRIADALKRKKVGDAVRVVLQEAQKKANIEVFLK